jgi:hypothetical protein
VAADRIQRSQRTPPIVSFHFDVDSVTIYLKPESPRSGFSFLSMPDGIILHGKLDASRLCYPTDQNVGGYCKEYTKGKRPVGVMLDDTWLLRLVL